MKRRLLLIILTLAATACLITGCSLKRLSKEELFGEGYTYEVTFDFMGGKSSGNDSLILLVKPDSLLAQPKSGEIELGEPPTREGFTFNGNYYRKAERGELLYPGENGGEDVYAYNYSDPWDFSTDKVTEAEVDGEGKLTLYAGWIPGFRVTVHFYGEDEDGKEFRQDGSIGLSRNDAGELETLRESSFTNAKPSGYTIVSYYDVDPSKGAAEEIAFPYAVHAEEGNYTGELWAEVVYGNFKIVKEKKDLNSIGATTNLYFKQDIDCEGAEIYFPEGKYVGMIYGNGFTLSGFKVVREQKRGERWEYAYGMFLQLGSSAVIRDINFTDVGIVVAVGSMFTPQTPMVGAFAGTVEEGATLENVVFEGTLDAYLLASYDVPGIGFEEIEIGAFFGDGTPTPAGCTANVVCTKHLYSEYGN